MALALHGTLRFADVAAAAIGLADDGFPTYRYLAAAVHSAPETYSRWPGNAAVFLPQGRPPRVGEMFYQKDLAATLCQLVAIEESHRTAGRLRALQAARDCVYKGDLAEKIVSFCQAEGGLLTMEDLENYYVRCEPPVTVNYRGYDIYATGPWGQGPVFPQALKLLDGFDVRAMGHNSAAYVHTVNQALNLAFADREQYIGDPAFVNVPMRALLSEDYLRERRKLIDPERAWPAMPPAGDPRQGTLQVFLNVVEFGFDPQEAVEAPRFYSYSFPNSGFPSAYNPGLMRAESRITPDVLEALRQRGHTVETYPDWWEDSCLYGVIRRDPSTGVLQGGADPRGEAYAVGY